MNSDVRNTIESIWQKTLVHEYDILEKAKIDLPAKCRYLEIGCGSLGLLQRINKRLNDIYPNSVGIDINLEKLTLNKQVQFPICSSCYTIPLKSESIDIIVCRWLVEHLEYPDKAFREMGRVLKEGGILYVVTPNIYNYAMLISNFTPTWFHNLIRSAGDSHDNTDTFYKANSKRKLKRLASDNNFEISLMETEPHSFMYYSFNKTLFFFMKKISHYISYITTDMHLKITCLMKKN